MAILRFVPSLAKYDVFLYNVLIPFRIKMEFFSNIIKCCHFQSISKCWNDRWKRKTVISACTITSLTNVVMTKHLQHNTRGNFFLVFSRVNFNFMHLRLVCVNIYKVNTNKKTWINLTRTAASRVLCTLAIMPSVCRPLETAEHLLLVAQGGFMQISLQS